MALFTVFIVLPSEEVCTLRNVASGVTVCDIRCKLELAAGLPAQIYNLQGNGGRVLPGEHVLELGKNVWDGFLLKVQLLGSWQPLYDAVVRSDLGWLLRNCTVHFRQHEKNVTEDEWQPEQSFEEVTEEKGAVALYSACWMGAVKICRGLLSAGVNPNGMTPFRRTPLFAAVIRDSDEVLEILLTHSAKLNLADCSGETPVDVARHSSSRQCVNKIRTFQLAMRGHVSSGSKGKTPSEISFGSFPRTMSNDRLSLDASVVTTPRNIRPLTVKLKQQATKPRPQTAIAFKTKSNFDIHLQPRSFSRESSRDKPQLRGTNGFIRPFNFDLDLHPSSPRGQGKGPPSVTSSPRRSSHTIDHGGNTPRGSVGVPLRVAISKKNDSSSKKSRNVVTWNDRLTEAELLQARSSNREEKVQLNSISSKTKDNITIPNMAWDVTEPNTIPRNTDVEGRLNTSFDNSHDSHAPENAEDEFRSKTVIGYARGVEEEHSKENADKENNENDESPKEEKKEMRVRFTQSANVFRHRPKSRHKQGESLTTAKRRIQLAEQQKVRARTADLRRKETFEQWLEKKRRQEREAKFDKDTDESSSEDEQDSQAFHDWLKEIRDRPKNQINPKSAVSLHHRKTRAMKGLVGIESSAPNQPMTAVDTASYMHALDDWREKQQKLRSKMNAVPTDAKGAKKRLEEKREELLAMAITYDEWVEHTEERNQLIKVIQQADSEKLKEIEKGKLFKRPRKAISFEQWRQKLNEREVQEKGQRSCIGKGYEAGQHNIKATPKKRNVSFER